MELALIAGVICMIIGLAGGAVEVVNRVMYERGVRKDRERRLSLNRLPATKLKDPVMRSVWDHEAEGALRQGV